MAEALILGSEALHALANWSERGALAGRSRAILALAKERGAHVRVPAPVLAEVCRGPKFDAAINHALKARGILVDELTESIARIAGAILARRKSASLHVIDAFVVPWSHRIGMFDCSESDFPPEISQQRARTAFGLPGYWPVLVGGAAITS